MRLNFPFLVKKCVIFRGVKMLSILISIPLFRGLVSILNLFYELDFSV